MVYSLDIYKNGFKILGSVSDKKLKGYTPFDW